MTGFMKRIEDLKAELKPLPGLCWVLADGSKVPAEGVNDPYNLLTHGEAEGAKPTVMPGSAAREEPAERRAALHLILLGVN